MNDAVVRHLQLERTVHLESHAARARVSVAHKLMGPECRDRIPVGYWSCHMAPEDTAREAAQAARGGFKHHKLKARL